MARYGGTGPVTGLKFAAMSNAPTVSALATTIITASFNQQQKAISESEERLALKLRLFKQSFLLRLRTETEYMQ